MEFGKDGKDQLYVVWDQGGAKKRAWIQTKDDPEKDWAKTKRYLNVVRCNEHGNPGGNATDFPVFDKRLSDEQILRAFVYSISSITGCQIPDEVA